MKFITRRIVVRLATILSVVALFSALVTNGAACSFMTYQPTEPQELAKFLKH